MRRKEKRRRNHELSKNNEKWRTIEEVRGGGGWVEGKKEVSP